MKRLKSDLLLFALGGAAYGLIELLYRRRTHWSMVLTGGACCTSIVRFYRRFSRMTLPLRCVCGSAIITAYEFACGCIVNLGFKMNVWDYSNCRFNIKGQICPFYSMLWALLCIPLSAVCRLVPSCAVPEAAEKPKRAKRVLSVFRGSA